MGYLAEVEVRKYGHRFEVGVDEETAKVLVSIDGGEPENAKALQDGKVVFFGDREIIVKGEIKLIRYVDLADADFSYLRAAVDRIKIDQAASKEAKRRRSLTVRKLHHGSERCAAGDCPTKVGRSTLSTISPLAQTIILSLNTLFHRQKKPLLSTRTID